MKPDKITVYKSDNEYRWTRRSSGNNKIIGASSEGYARKEGVLRNIERTQKGPYVIEVT